VVAVHAGKRGGSSRTMLATARPSYLFIIIASYSRCMSAFVKFSFLSTMLSYWLERMTYLC